MRAFRSLSNRALTIEGWSRRARSSRSGRGDWGGRGGSLWPWDDGPHRGVRSIAVTYNGRSLESISVEYVDSNGRPVHGEKHGGGTDRSHSLKIEVDFPYEFLTGVSGCYRAAHGGAPPVVRSLAFATSRGTVHGPFGDADADGAVPFSYPMERGVVVGFTGRSGWHVDALGLYIAALRPEMLFDVVQERGLMAYRSFVYGDAQPARHHQNRRPFEWCYK